MDYKTLNGIINDIIGFIRSFIAEMTEFVTGVKKI